MSAARPGAGSSSFGRPLAVVDVGSNSTRLLLCTGVDATGPRGERITTVTGLRRGAGADGTIAGDALARLDAALERYGRMMSGAGVDTAVALGTSAVREAPNRDRVAGMVLHRLGVRLTVLSGDEEARLAFAGARLSVPGDEPVLMVDIGGGSTELVRGTAEEVEGALSLRLGAVRDTERLLRHDPPRPDELRRLRAEALVTVGAALAAIGGPAPVLGVAGTATTLAAIHLGRYDPARVDGCRLRRTDVEEMIARLAAMPLAARRRVPGLEPDRAPVIVAGAVIAACVLEAAGADVLTVGERDLLDGAVLASVPTVAAAG